MDFFLSVQLHFTINQMIITKYSEQINMLCQRDTNIGRFLIGKEESLNM